MAKQEYKVQAERIGSEQVPISLTIPLEVLREKQDVFKNYTHAPFVAVPEKGSPLAQTYEELRKQGVQIPDRFDWEGFICEHILELSEMRDSGYNLVDSVASCQVKGGDLEVICKVSDSDWNH